MPEEKKYGIENLWKILELVLEGGNVAGTIVANNGEGIKWYQRFLFPLGALGDEIIGMFGVDYATVLPEFKDLDDAEKADLMARAVVKFDIPQDQVEAVVEASFVIAFKLGDLVKESIELAKSFKK